MKYAGIDGAQSLLRGIVAALPLGEQNRVGTEVLTKRLGLRCEWDTLEEARDENAFRHALHMLVHCGAIGCRGFTWWRIG